MEENTGELPLSKILQHRIRMICSFDEEENHTRGFYEMNIHHVSCLAAFNDFPLWLVMGFSERKDHPWLLLYHSTVTNMSDAPVFFFHQLFDLHCFYEDYKISLSLSLSL